MKNPETIRKFVETISSALWGENGEILKKQAFDNQSIVLEREDEQKEKMGSFAN